MPTIKIFPDLQSPLDTGVTPDTLDPDLTIGEIDETNAPAPVTIVSGEWSNGDTLFVNGNSQFVIEAINKLNPEVVKEFVGAEAFKEKTEKRYPWSYEDGTGKAAIAYRLTGTVTGKFNSGKIPVFTGATVSFGLQANSTVGVSFISIHSGSEKLVEAMNDALVAGNPGRYQFPLAQRGIHELAPEKEFLVTEFEAGLGFTAEFSWGQLFRSNPGLVRKLFPTGAFTEKLESEPLLKGDASASAKIAATVSGRMELIAYMESSDVARIEFRKASKGTLGVSAGLKVTANILDKETARAVLDSLLGRVSDPIHQFFGEADDKIEKITDSILDWRSNLDPSSLFTGADQAVATAIARIENSLSLDLSKLLSLNERVGEIQKKSNEYAELLNLPETGMNDLKAKIDTALSSLDVTQLPPEYAPLAQSILDTLSIDPGPLASLLAIPSYQDKVVGAINSNIKQQLDPLRKELLRLIDDVDLPNLVSKGELNLLRLVEEHTGLSLSDIAASFSTEKLITSLLPDGIEDVDALMSKIVDAVTGTEIADAISDVKTRGIVSKISEWFGIDFSMLPDKFDDVLDRLATGISREAEISAEFEFTRTREREAFFSCQFSGMNQAGHTRDLCKEVYENLLVGNLEAVLDRYNSNAKSLFKDLTFFSALKIEDRTSFSARLIWPGVKEKAVSSRMIATNVNREEVHEYMEMGAYEADEKFINFKLKRHYRGLTTITSRSDDYLDPASITADKFSTNLSTSITWGGRVKKAFLGVNGWNAKINREMILIFARAADASPKYSGGGSLEGTLLKEFQNATKKDYYDLKLHLDMGPEAVDFMWENAPPTDWENNNSNGILMEQYETAWPRLKQWIIAGQFDVQDYNRDRKKYFNALSQLADSVQSAQEVEDFRKYLTQWRRQYHLRGNAGWRLEKFAYMLSILAILPEELPGWSVSTTLTKNDEQMFLA